VDGVILYPERALVLQTSYDIWTGRRHFPRTLFVSRDLDAAIAFARSAGRTTVVFDRNEHRRVWEPPPDSEFLGENGENRC
jgi:hypothetical protein